MTSILACELTNKEDRRIGLINVYWNQRRAFTADDTAYTNVFARHAALSLTHSLDEAGLNVALDGRKLIGQTQGILMATYDLDHDRAFEGLASNRSHIRQHLLQRSKQPVPAERVQRPDG